METDEGFSIVQFQFFKLVEACEEHQRIVRYFVETVLCLKTLLKSHVRLPLKICQNHERNYMRYMSHEKFVFSIILVV